MQVWAVVCVPAYALITVRFMRSCLVDINCG